ncbi:Ig-like domain-containing protein [Sphingobacterium sp.]|uniref:Ig-like domain-containing protein n=1 Tax=Sphingobacterium sp. TaxID=341027 RepID=UPI0028AB9C85|nr:invasin domain 3-containing protein [Sphingobacterium sp.]
MKPQTNSLALPKRIWHLCILLALILMNVPGTGHAQTRQYATVAPSSGKNQATILLGAISGGYTPTNSNAASVTGPGLAADGNPSTHAVLTASNLSVAIIDVSGEAWLQMKFPSALTAGTTTYVKIDKPTPGGGLNLDLVTGLGGLLGLLQQNVIIPEVYSGASSSSDGTMINSASVVSSIVQDAAGNIYVAVKSSQSYNSVRIKLRSQSALLGLSLGASLTLNVYDAFAVPSATACDPATYTDEGKVTGINVQLANTVKNPTYAIDANTSNYSEISLGTLAVGGSASQSIYFPTLSAPNSKLKVRMQINPTALNVNLIGAYGVRAYNGNTQVFEQVIGSGLIGGLDVLGLLNSGGIVTVPFDIAAQYDRVELVLFSTVNLTTGSGVRLYGVSRTSAACPEPPPTASPLFQPVCANSTIVSMSNVDDAQNAVDANFDSYATIRSDAGILVGLGSRQGQLEVSFPSAVPVGKTAYVRIDYDQDVLKSLLAGSIGELVGGLVNGLVLGNHYFEVQINNGGGAPLLSASSANSFSAAAGKIRIVQDKAGRYYIAIKSDVPYTNIKLIDHTASALGVLAPNKYLNVYSVCYDNSSAICDPAFSTSYEGTGITLGLLQIGNTGVLAPEYAIDDDVNTSSKINLGALAVAGSMSQYINFNSLSDPNSVFKIKLAIKASQTLNVDLLGAYEVIAYNGSTEVYRRSLGGGLLNGTNVLGILGGGQPGTLTFAPGKAFDRVEIRVNSVVNVSAFQSSLEVYDVKRFGPPGSACPDPDFTLPAATATPFETPACDAAVVAWEHADYPNLAADGNNESFATLTASNGQLLGIGAYNGFLEYEFPTALPANKTTYVRIDMDGDLLGRLLSGTLGTLVNNVGGLLLGQHYFSVDAKTAQTGGTTVLTGSSQAGFTDVNGGDLRIVQDNAGRYYIAITPNAAYKNIRITEHFPALAGLTQNVASMKIFEACHEIGVNNCLPAQFTSFDQSGLSLGLLNGAGVNNADHAISPSSSDYSEISTGTAAVAAQVAQRIYFNKLSTAGDTLKVRLQLDPSSLASVDLLGRYQIRTYNGSTVAETFTLQQGLINNLNLLNLFRSGGIQTLAYRTTLPYDRVDIIVGSTLNVALTPSVRLYEVKRIGQGCPTTTTPSPFENPVCISSVIDAGNADDINNLFDNDFDSYATLKSGAGLLLGLGNKYEGFVELGFGQKIAANKTAYIRIDFDQALLNNLLGGSIGGTLASVVNNLVLGNHYFSVQVKDAGSVILQGGSNNNFNNNNDRIRIVQDKLGRYYIAVTPSAQYDAIRITDHTNSALGLLAQPNSMNVYGACVDNPLTDCQPVFTTSYDARGLALTALGLAGSGVTNPDHAININTTDYSEVSLGNVAVGTSVKQYFDFRKLALPSEVINLTLQYGSGALDANLIGGIEIIAYNGVTPVATLDVQSQLINGLNVLGILNNGAKGVIPFAPGVAYDRISVGLRGVLNVSALPALRVYAVEKDCNTPMFKTWKSFKVSNDPAITTVKGGEEVEYTIHVRNTGNVALNDYIVTDAIPANTAYVAGSADASGGSLSSGVVTFSNVDIAAGATATLSFKVTVNPDLTGVANITNVALVKKDAADPGKETFPPAVGNPNEPDETAGTGTKIPVTPIASAVSWKAYKVNTDASITAVKGGEQVEYAIYVRNNGNQVLNNVQISDVLPAGVTYVSGGSQASGTVSFVIPTLAVGATNGPLTFTVSVNQNLSGITKITNIATVKSNENNVPAESFPPVNNANPTEPNTGAGPGTSLDVTPVNNLVSWKAYKVNNDATITSVKGGEDVQYTIYVRNDGNQNATGVLVSDVLPAGLTHKNGGTLTGGTVNFAPLDIPVGQVRSVSFIATVIKDLTNITQINNIALAKLNPADPGVQSHPPINNSDPLTGGPDITQTGTVIAVTPAHDVDFALLGLSNNTTSTSKAVEGDVITYTLTVKNTGNAALTNVTITAPIPTHTTYEAGTITGGGTVAGNEATFVIPSLAVDQTLTFSYKVLVGAIPPGVDKITNTSVVSFANEISGQPNKTKQALSELQTNCTPVVAADITLAPTSGTICVGDEVEITASTALNIPNAVYLWYTNPALTGTPLVGPVQRLSPAVTTTYYVVLSGDGFCFNTPAKEIEISVLNLPPIPTISITGSATICEGTGSTVLTATSAGASSYQWYKNGVVFLNTNTNTLTVNEAGLYTVKAFNDVNATGCSSDVSAAVEVIVTPRPAQPVITAPTAPTCEGSIIELTSSATAGNQWYKDGLLLTENNNGTTVPVTGQKIFVSTGGVYTVKVTDQLTGCESLESADVTIVINPLPVITLTGETRITTAVNVAVTLPTVTTSPATGVTVKWYDQAGVETTNLTPSFAAPGVYTYTVVAQNDATGCTSSQSVLIQVYDANSCPPQLVRVYANTQSSGSIITGGVSDGANAVDGNPKTYSTITTGLGLLGIGTTWQNVNFDQVVPAGTPVTIKLGKEYSLLSVASGLSVVGLDANGNDIGTLKSVQGGLLDLLVADNVVEYTFVPASGSGPKAYKGVRIVQGALLSLAQNAKVYHAYYTKTGAVDCAPIDNQTNSNILDMLYGVQDIGLGVASATASVIDPWLAVDNDLNTAAQINRGAAVLNVASLTPVFKSQTMPTDSLRIIIEDSGNALLNLSLLSGFEIQRYLGTAKVGPTLDNSADILKLKLLSFSANKKKLMMTPFDQPFDRVQISYGDVVNVNLGNQIKVYDVSIIPTIDYGNTPGTTLEICQGDNLTIKKQDDCTVYAVYDENGNLLVTSDQLNFTIPATTTAGVHKYFIQAVRQGCEIGPRQEIEVLINPLPVVQTLNINGQVRSGNEISLSPGKTATFELTVDDATATFQWQELIGGTWTAIAGQATSTLVRTVPLVAAGTRYEFRALISSTKGCDIISPVAALVVAPQQVDYTKSKLEIVKNNAIANGTDVNTLRATIVDEFDNPIAATAVDFSYTSLVTGSVVTTQLNTDASGIALLDITSTKIGDVAVAATVAATAISGSPQTVTFVAGPVDYGKSKLVIIKDGAIANGVDKNILEATIVDAFDNSIAGATVNFGYTDLTDGLVKTVNIVTDALGKSVLELTSTKIGAIDVSAGVAGTAISGSPQTVTFVAGPVDYDKSKLVITKDGAIANGVDKNILEATIVDAFDNPIAGAAVVFGYTDLVDGLAKTVNVVTGANGKSVLELTSTKIGAVTVSAEVSGTAISGSPQTVTFVAGPVDYGKSKLVIIKDGATANGVDKNILEATIVDAFDNPIAGATVDFGYTDLVDGQVKAVNIVTDASGKSVLELTSTKIGAIDVSALVAGTAISGSPQTVTFVAGPVDYGKSKLVIIKDGATANGVDKNILEATIVDAFDNPIAGATVDFGYTDLTDGLAKTVNIVTAANGKSVLELTSTKIGAIDVSAGVAGTAISGSPQTVTFVAGPVDYGKSKLVIIKDGATANGVDKNILEATIVDAFDNPIAGATVDFGYTDLTDGLAKTVNIVTAANGKSVLELTSTKIGAIDVSAGVAGTAISGSPQTVTFVAGPVDYGKSKLVIIKDGATANGVDKNILEATIVDAFDNPIAGATVDFGYTDLTDGLAKTVNIVTDASGKSVLELTSTKIGAVTVSAGVAGTAISGSPQTVTFVAGPVDYGKSKLVIIKDGATANGVDKNILEATIVDAFDNPIAGATVDFGYTDLTDGLAKTANIVTAAIGKSVLELTSTKIGAVTVSAGVAGTAISGSPQTVTFVAGPVDYDKSNLAVTKDGAIANGTDYNEFTATIVDAFNNPIASTTVVFSITNPDGTTATQSITTDANGKSVVQVTSTKAGTVTVDAQVANRSIANSPANAQFVAGPVDYGKSKLVIIKDGATANGVDKNILEATIVDAFDNPIAGATVDFGYTDLVDGQAKTVNIVTAANGKSVLELTSTKIGAVTVSAGVAGTAISGSPQTVTFVAGPVDYDKSNLAVTKDGAIANGTDYNEFTATIVDAFVNPIANTTVVFSITNPDGTTATQSITTDANGKSIVQLTSTKAGTVTVDAQVANRSIANSPAKATFVAGPVDYDKSNLAVTKDGAIANGTDYNEFTATIVDAFNNPIANTTVVFGITNPDGTTATQNITTDANGKSIVQVTSTKTGTVTVDAQVANRSIANSPATAQFVAGPVDYSKSNLAVTKDGAIANGTDYNEFTATIVDAFLNPIANTTVVFSITNPDGTTATRSIITDANGKSVVQVTSTKAGTVTVDAQVANRSIANSPAKATFVIANHISVSKVADQARVKAGTSTSFTITLTNDGPETLAAGKVISLTERPGVGVTITGYTVASGNATVTGTGNTAKVTANGTIAVGGTIVVKVTADIAADAPATVTNGITVWGPDKDPGTDPEDDKDDTDPIPVDREYKLSITKVADQARVKAGTSTSFTLTITNNGPAIISTGKVISLTERPGAGVTITGYSVASGAATVAGTANTAKLTTTANIAVGATIVVKVTANVVADAPATITNGITVWGPDKDPGTDPEDDKDDTDPIPVDRETKLSITKVADEARVKAGEATSFTLTITNDGPSVMETGKVISLRERPGTGVTVTGYSIISGTATVSGTSNSASVTTTAAIPVGGKILVKVAATVSDDAAATITNGITVWAPGKNPDTDPEDDKDDTDPIPVDFQTILAVDDEAETKAANEVKIEVLANDQVTKWAIDPATVEIVTNAAEGTTSVNIDGTVTYLPNKVFVGVDQFSYRVKDVKGRWSNAAVVKINVLSNPLIVPNVITPNGDNINDKFVLKGIETYDRVSLTIINRWGNEVYRNANYDNNWEGLNLNAGTYFYIIETTKNGVKEVVKGDVLIKRN